MRGQAFTLHVYGEISSSKAIKRISPRINSDIGVVIKVSRAYKSLHFYDDGVSLSFAQTEMRPRADDGERRSRARLKCPDRSCGAAEHQEGNGRAGRRALGG